MKFTCDSCGAGYMISDEKVGPNGVKVRCKKCGNMVTVRRGDEPPAATAAAPTDAAPPAGLDDELGNAFDHAFGDAPAAPAAAPAPAAAAAPAPAAPAGLPATEWYVAIGEAQVGPLPLVEVKKKWEGGEIGPDSLVWRPGMADWGPLSGVPDLAAFLAPVPQPPRPAAASAASAAAVRTAAPRVSTPVGGTPAAAPSAPSDVSWKPSGASALSSLAEQELTARADPGPAAKPAPRKPLLDSVPDTGGVDPTGAIPLSIKGMEHTDEKPIRRSSVARGAEEVRHRRTVRTVVMVALVVVVVVAGAAGGAVWYLNRPAPVPPPVEVAKVPPPAPPPVTPPAPPPAAPEVPPPTTATAAPPAVAPPAPEKAPEPVPEKVAAAPVKPAAPATGAKPKVPPAGAKPKPVAVAKGEPAPAAAAPPKAAPPKKKDSVLDDFDKGGEDDLAAALGGPAGGRKVYVPPAPGGAGGGGLPDRLSDAQITESVKERVDALRKCVGEQQAREPGAKGTIKMAWTIQPDGTTKDVRCLTSEYAASPFAACIGGVVRKIQFPRIGDPKGQPVNFPFGF